MSVVVKQVLYSCSLAKPGVKNNNTNLITLIQLVSMQTDITINKNVDI